MSDLKYKEGMIYLGDKVDIDGNTIEAVDNPEWMEVTTDSDGRILHGIRKDGSSYESWRSANTRNNLYIDPIKFGAIYDGVTDCSKAINECLDIGGVIRFVGVGTVLCKSPLIIKKSNTTILADDTITIKRANGVSDALISTIGGTYNSSQQEATQNWLSNIVIDGGIWDLNGENNSIESDSPELWTKGGFKLADVTNLQVINIKVKNTKGFCFVLGDLYKFQFENILFSTTGMNGDGLHFSGNCISGIIRNIYGSTSDDMIALNGSGDFLDYREGDIRSVKIENIFLDKNLAETTNNALAAVRVLCNDTYTVSDVVIDGIFGVSDGKWKGLINLSNWLSDARMGKITIKNVYAYQKYIRSITPPIIINVGDRLEHNCTVDCLNIDGISVTQKQDGINKIINVQDNATVNRLLLSNVCIDSEDVSNAGVNFISGGTIKTLIMNNIQVKAPETAYRMPYLIDCVCDRVFLSNAEIGTDVLINTEKIQNCLQANVLLI